MIIDGRVWRLGDGVGATDLIPARYDKIGMKRDWAACAEHLLEDAAPGFAQRVQPGDVIVAGTDFGWGHAHYFGAVINALKHVRLGAVFASSLSGVFFRAATDLGLVTWTYGELAELTSTDDRVEVDLSTGAVHNHTTHVTRRLDPPPSLILELFEAGGSAPWALRRARKLAPTP